MKHGTSSSGPTSVTLAAAGSPTRSRGPAELREALTKEKGKGSTPLDAAARGEPGTDAATVTMPTSTLDSILRRLTALEGMCGSLVEENQRLGQRVAGLQAAGPLAAVQAATPSRDVTPLVARSDVPPSRSTRRQPQAQADGPRGSHSFSPPRPATKSTGAGGAASLPTPTRTTGQLLEAPASPTCSMLMFPSIEVSLEESRSGMSGAANSLSRDVSVRTPSAFCQPTPPHTLLYSAGASRRGFSSFRSSTSGTVSAGVRVSDGDPTALDEIAGISVVPSAFGSITTTPRERPTAVGHVAHMSSSNSSSNSGGGGGGGGGASEAVVVSAESLTGGARGAEAAGLPTSPDDGAEGGRGGGGGTAAAHVHHPSRSTTRAHAGAAGHGVGTTPARPPSLRAQRGGAHAPAGHTASPAVLSPDTFCEGMTIGSVSLTLTQEIAKVMLGMRRHTDELELARAGLDAERAKRRSLAQATVHQFKKITSALKAHRKRLDYHERLLAPTMDMLTFDSAGGRPASADLATNTEATTPPSTLTARSSGTNVGATSEGRHRAGTMGEQRETAAEHFTQSQTHPGTAVTGSVEAGAERAVDSSRNDSRTVRPSAASVEATGGGGGQAQGQHPQKQRPPARRRRSAEDSGSLREAAEEHLTSQAAASVGLPTTSTSGSTTHATTAAEAHSGMGWSGHPLPPLARTDGVGRGLPRAPTPASRAAVPAVGSLSATHATAIRVPTTTTTTPSAGAAASPARPLLSHGPPPPSSAPPLDAALPAVIVTSLSSRPGAVGSSSSGSGGGGGGGGSAALSLSLSMSGGASEPTYTRERHRRRPSPANPPCSRADPPAAVGKRRSSSGKRPGGGGAGCRARRLQASLSASLSSASAPLFPCALPGSEEKPTMSGAPLSCSREPAGGPHAWVSSQCGHASTSEAAAASLADSSSAPGLSLSTQSPPPPQPHRPVDEVRVASGSGSGSGGSLTEAPVIMKSSTASAHTLTKTTVCQAREHETSTLHSQSPSESRSLASSTRRTPAPLPPPLSVEVLAPQSTPSQDRHGAGHRWSGSGGSAGVALAQERRLQSCEGREPEKVEGTVHGAALAASAESHLRVTDPRPTLGCDAPAGDGEAHVECAGQGGFVWRDGREADHRGKDEAVLHEHRDDSRGTAPPMSPTDASGFPHLRHSAGPRRWSSDSRSSGSVSRSSATGSSATVSCLSERGMDELAACDRGVPIVTTPSFLYDASVTSVFCVVRDQELSMDGSGSDHDSAGPRPEPHGKAPAGGAVHERHVHTGRTAGGSEDAHQESARCLVGGGLATATPSALVTRTRPTGVAGGSLTRDGEDATSVSVTAEAAGSGAPSHEDGPAAAESHQERPGQTLARGAPTQRRANARSAVTHLSASDTIAAGARRRVSFLSPSPHTADRERRQREEEAAMKRVEEAILGRMKRRAAS